MGAMWQGIVNAAIATTGTLMSSERERNAKLGQVAQMESNADAMRKNTRTIRGQGEAEAFEIDRQKSKLHQQYVDIQGHNRSLLGAGNVDMSSGSAAAVAEGNINRYAADIGDNAYKRALRLWDADSQARVALYQADALDSQASYMKKTAGSLGTSIITSLLAGGEAFMNTYSMGGGSMSSLTSGASANSSSPNASSSIDWSQIFGKSDRAKWPGS